MRKLWILFADSVAALMVALIVIVISYRLGKRSIAVLTMHRERKYLKLRIF
ncbi:MAG: hypothetical protein IPN68_17495 [Bacteroidetes bacterium]|nr:hypothetical protein [Bacteroidota bacterium]